MPRRTGIAPGHRGCLTQRVLILRRNAPALFATLLWAGAVRAQDAAIEQSRLLQQHHPTAAAATGNSEGMAVGDADEDSDDDSFGAQLILKSQERRRSFTLSAEASSVYTSNVALVRRSARADGFFVGNASAAWAPRISTHFEGQVVAHVASFRYFDNSVLDFSNFGIGAAVAYSTPEWPGVSVVGRYDFTELINRHAQEILSDHQLTVAAQKGIPLGRSHYVTLGLLGTAGISDPFAAQRDSVGAFGSYHLNISRSLETDLSYRYALYVYTQGDRTDRNQLVSLALRYRFTEWADAQAFFSYGNNWSDVAVFDYSVMTAGGGVGVRVRF